MNKTLCSALIGMIIGVWLAFAIKHIAFIFITILCIFALRYLFSEFTQ